MIAVRVAGAVDCVSEFSQHACQPVDLFRGRWGYRCAGRDMFPDLVQRDVEILGGRPVQAQCDFGFHPTTLLTCRDPRGAAHGAFSSGGVIAAVGPCCLPIAGLYGTRR